MPKWFYVAILTLAIATASGILKVDQARQDWQVQAVAQRTEGLFADAEGDR